MIKNCRIEKILLLILCLSMLVLVKKDAVYAEKMNSTNYNVLYSATSAQYYTTYFDANEGSCSIKSNSYQCGTAYGTLPTPTRSNHKFLGWYFNKNWAEKDRVYSTTNVRSATVTLYARWEQITSAQYYTTYFDANEGSCSIKSNSYQCGTAYGTLPTPTRSNYKFLGWYFNKNWAEKDRVYSTTKVKSTAVTLYARWEQIISAQYYTTVFDPNDGVCSVSRKDYKCGEYYGTLPTPTRNSYKFLGWYFSKNWAEKDKVSSTTSVRSLNVTLYARWERITYTTTFDGNGGTCSVASRNLPDGIQYGDALSSVSVKRDGYTFISWKTRRSGGDVVSSKSYVPAENRTLYAQWTAIPYCTIFNANGGTSDASYVIFRYNETYGLNLPGASWTGHTFLGWFTEKNGGNKVTSNMTVPIGDRTLYAHWSVNTYITTFDANGGTCNVSSRTILQGIQYKDALTSVIVSRESYVFDGWYTEKIGGDKVTQDSYVPSKNITLYAHWLAKVTFDAKGGKCSVTCKTYNCDLPYGALPTASKDGYTFNGWYTSNGKKVTKNTIATESCTLHASWIAKYYATYYDANGGVCEKSYDIFPYGSTYGTRINSVVPTREGYNFTGWYYDVADNNKKVSSGDYIQLSNVTIYAHWERITYAVKYDCNGGSLGSRQYIEIEYKESDANLILPTPSKLGCVFLGWFTSKNGGDKVYADSKVTDTGYAVLYAHWCELKLCYNNSYYNMDVEDNMVINCLGYNQELVFSVNSDVNIIKVYSSADWIDENFVFNNESKVLHIFINANRYDKREAEIKVFADNGTWKKFNISQGAVDKFANANYEDYIFGSNKENGITLGSYFEKAETCGGDVDGLFTPNHNGIIKVCTDHFLYYETYFTGMCFYTDWILVNCTDKKGVNWCYDDSGKKIGKYGYEWDDILEVDMQVELERTNAVNSSVAARFVTGLQKGNDILLKTDVNGSAHLEKDSDYYSLFKNSYKTYKSLVSVASVLSGNPSAIIMSTVDLAVNGVELVGWIGDQEEYTIEHDGKPRLYKSYYVDAEGENNSRVQNPDDLSINAVKFGMDYTSGYKLKKEGDQYNVDFIYCNAGLNNYKGNNEMAGAYAENGIENSLYTVYIIEFEINDKMTMYYDVYGFEDSEKWKSDKDPSKIEGKMGFIPTISANSFYKTGKLYLRKPAPNT